MLTSTFLFAGRASFIIRNPKGEHVTVVARLRKAQDVYSISVRHMNEAWAYVGAAKATDMVHGRILPTFKTQPVEARTLKIASWGIRMLAGDQSVPTGYALEHTGRCGKCGKMLRDPESLKLGLGPVCRGGR